MKRVLFFMVVLLAMVAFVSGVMAQASPKTEKPVAPAAEKPKADKPKAMKFSGIVVAYEAGKMIKVKGAKDKEMIFDVTGDTKIKGEVKEGAKVNLRYKKEVDKVIATDIVVSGGKPPKKAPEKAPEKK
jgi:hypothetical protein